MTLARFNSVLKTRYTKIVTKDNKCYHGRMVSMDKFANIVLVDVELNYKNKIVYLEEVFIKGSNIRYYTLDYELLKKKWDKMNK